MSLYNLRSADGSYRIQKFDEELNPLFDSSYLISENFKECSCPAGHRQTCRHRQMLGPMLAANLLDSPDFWNHDLNRVEPGQVAFIDEAANIDPKLWAKFGPFDPGQERSETPELTEEQRQEQLEEIAANEAEYQTELAKPVFKRRF